MLSHEPGPLGTQKSNKTIKYYAGAIRTKDRYYRTWARASWTIQKLHEILFFKYIYIGLKTVILLEITITIRKVHLIKRVKKL